MFLRLAAAALLSLAATAAAAQDAPKADAPKTKAEASGQTAAAPLSVRFTGVKTLKGVILVAVVDEQGYAGKAKPVAVAAAPATAETVTAEIGALPPGRYAVQAFQDIDGDHKMGTNPFGVPTEPYAFSRNAKGTMGKPKFEDAAFDSAAPGDALTISLD